MKVKNIITSLRMKFEKLDKKKIILRLLIICFCIALVIGSNLYLQYCQNNLDFELAKTFAFDWHKEKFMLSCGVLLVLLLFLISVTGFWWSGSLLYTFIIGVLGYADYQKMLYRDEPIYPDDLSMITELGLLKEMVPTYVFYSILILAIILLGFIIWVLIKSLKKSKRTQLFRLGLFIFSTLMLIYISQFNQSNNLIRKMYNKTALWIPYSQKMNYYNTGFVAGFLYNLDVTVMDEPSGYSESAIQTIAKKYNSLAETSNASDDVVNEDDNPNIIFIMSESFSDPLNLVGIDVKQDPLKKFRAIDASSRGLMLSQNYGGGTANIEFEALTGFSMELFSAQLTTPYTMLVPKLEQFPSIVSLLNNENYVATAIHPYNTSMYKRKDVYNVLGFDSFINEDTMENTETIENNPYISDESAYKEVSSLLDDTSAPQFVHLVTMQTHMPYNMKYTSSTYDDNVLSSNITNFFQDIDYSSEALSNFLSSLDNLSRRTLVVFWGDHLPSIYSDEVKALNEKSGALYETPYLIYDSKHQLKIEDEELLSPIYFAPTLFQGAHLPQSGFYSLLQELKTALPAFEKNRYYQNGKLVSEVELTDEEQSIYNDYQKITYDVVAGKQYSMEESFFVAK